MKIKYLGESDPLYFLNGKEYEVIAVEEGWYRTIDETGEDYLYSPDNFEIVEGGETTLEEEKIMVSLSRRQSKFLETELGISVEQIKDMNKKRWVAIREKCYDIVLDELLDKNDNYNEEKEISERCLIAESIMDIMFKDLKS